MVFGGHAFEPIPFTSELRAPDGGPITSISTFGEDARGELYIVDYGGELYRIEPVQ